LRLKAFKFTFGSFALILDILLTQRAATARYTITKRCYKNYEIGDLDFLNMVLQQQFSVQTFKFGMKFLISFGRVMKSTSPSRISL